MITWKNKELSVLDLTLSGLLCTGTFRRYGVWCPLVITTK
jgi:hypothetical protein